MAADPTLFWPKFNDYVWPEVECGDGLSVAVKVLDEYNIPVAPGSRYIGGALETVDIKHMDCLTVIKTSLFDEAAKHRTFYETTVNEDGEVEFIEVGSNNADMDIYYTIQTYTYKEPCKGVMVTGGKPLPVRKPIEWKLIWKDENGKYIYDSEGMEENCNATDFRRWANVVFKDPHTDSRFEDGIDNLYELTRENPWDKIIGYAYFIHHGYNVHNDVSVEYKRQSKVIVKVGEGGGEYGPSVGTLIKREEVAKFVEGCWFSSTTHLPEEGVEIIIPNEENLRYERIRGDETFPTDNFIGVSAIYITGIELDKCVGIRINKKGDRTPENSNIWVSAADATTKTIKLNEGTQYQIVYDETEIYKKPYVVFADNSSRYDPADFGTDVEFHLYTTGQLRDRLGDINVSEGTLLPLGGKKGFLIKNIWAVIELDTPSFEINDPKGKARDIANELEVLIAPLVLVEEPPPMAFNGEIINQAESKFDSDPTTEEDLSETEFELALDKMSGGGLTLTFSYLDEDEIRNLSEDLHKYMNDEAGDLETTYACGPNSEPRLGDKTPNGIVNNIRYSYNDSGSYTISVNAGGKIIGNFAELSQGLYFKQQADETGMTGTIIQDEGNHVVFKVRIDGFGDTFAMNCQNAILRVGDRVQCTIHNNPIGET